MVTQINTEISSIIYFFSFIFLLARGGNGGKGGRGGDGGQGECSI